MANLLGQLLVELGINTAAFKDGLDKSTYQAKAFANDLKQSFSSIGDSLSNLGSQMGLLSPQMSGAVQGVLGALEPLAKSLGTVHGGLAALIGVGAAAGVGVLGLAVHTAETAEHLNALSQATGVSVATLSGLGEVAGISGIGVDQLAKGLERMGRSAFAAAQAAPTASNAYKTLGIAVTDASGAMRDQTALFEDISTKFAAMKDGAEKTALAQQIFGRAGAELIPVFNRGGAEIADLVEHFTKLGAVMTGETAAAAEKVKENMALLEGGFTGVQNEILSGLAPALTVLTNQMVAGLEDGSGQMQSFVAGLVDVAKITINVFQGAAEIINLIGQGFKYAGEEFERFTVTTAKALVQLSHGNFSGAFKTVGDGAKQAADDTKLAFDDASRSVTDSLTNIQKVWTATNPTAKPLQGQENLPAMQVNLDFVNKTVEALERQAQKEEELAGAIGKVSASLIEQTATATANEAIQKLVDEATSKGVQNTEAFKEKMAEATPEIEKAALAFATFKVAIDAQKEFDNFDKKISEQIVALQAAAVAGNIVEQQYAKNEATLLPLKNALDALTTEWEKQAAAGADSGYLNDLGDKIRSLSAQYETAAQNVTKLDDAFKAGKINDEINKIKEQTAALMATNQALVNGDPYGKLDADLAKVVATLGLTDVEAAKVKATFDQLKNAQLQNQVLDASKAFGAPAQINALTNQITYLNNNWQSLNLSAMQYQQTLRALTAQQDDLTAKTGGFTDGLKAGFANFATTIQSQGQIMEKLTTSALNGISDQFAAMVVTGKAKWQDLINSMEQALLASEIKNLLNGLISGLQGAFNGSGQGFGGGFMSAFGGGKERGGDVSPGQWYVVGEKQPEIFVPHTSGTILPSASPGAMHGGDTHVSMYVNTPDANSFGKSSGQLVRDMSQQVGVVNARNRGHY